MSARRTSSRSRTAFALAALSASSTSAAQGYDAYRFTGPPQFEWAYGDGASSVLPERLSPQRAQFEQLLAIADECASAMWTAYSAQERSAQWLLYRKDNGRAVLWQRANTDISSADTDAGAVYASTAYPGGWMRRNISVPLISLPTSASVWGHERAVSTLCHELLHAIHVGTVSAQPGNQIGDIWRSFQLYILPGSLERATAEGMPRWLSEGIGPAQAWMLQRRTVAGQLVDFYGAAARTPQVMRRDLNTILRAFRTLGIRTYASSVFIDHWPERTATGERAGAPDLDTYYGTSSFHRWLARRIGWGRWFSAVSRIGSLRRDHRDRGWIRDFDVRVRHEHPQRVSGLCGGTNCGLREMVGTFLGQFAYEYERVPGDHRAGLFSQRGWLRWMFPPTGCTEFVFNADGTIQRSTIAPDGTERRSTVSDATLQFDRVDPFSGRCVQLAALDAAGNRRRASFDISVAPASSGRGGNSRCEDFVIASKAVRGTVRLGAAPQQDTLNPQARDGVDCFSSTLIDAVPTATSPNAIAVVSYVPPAIETAQERSFTVRISEVFSDTTRTNPPAVGGATQKRSDDAARLASRAAPPAGADSLVPHGAVILHDERGPSSCDRQWEHFCEPTSTISVATAPAGAAASEGMWAFPPSQIMDLPEEYTAEAIGNLPLSLAGRAQVAHGGRAHPDTVSIIIPRIRPGFTGVIQRALVNQRGDTSAGPNALRVDERCNHRYFEPQGTVTLTLNDGVRIEGTFEAPLFTDDGAQPDREGCVRARRRNGSIRGRFSTGFLASGWFFQDTHRDYATIAGTSADADFDRPQAWLVRTQRALDHQRSQLPPEERRRRDAEGEQAVTRMISAGAGLSLPTQCRCDCGEFLNPVSRASCTATCRERFAFFEREPARCAGQRATVVAPPVIQSNVSSAAPGEIDQQWSAFLQGLPSSARARLQQQVDRMDPATRPTMMQTIMRMMGAMQSSMQSTPAAQPTTNAGGPQS
jgi:hypothetical protein